MNEHTAVTKVTGGKGVSYGVTRPVKTPNITTMRHLYLLYYSPLIRRQFMRGTDPIKSTWVYPIF